MNRVFVSPRDARSFPVKHRITLIPGDGIGPEVSKPALKLIKAAGVDVEWETCSVGAEALKKHGTTIPKQLLDSFERNKIALKGPVTTPVGEGFASVNVELRQSFNLYANLRPNEADGRVVSPVRQKRRGEISQDRLRRSHRRQCLPSTGFGSDAA
jgi:isocitrate/isopropylmalate dehydrogenase